MSDNSPTCNLSNDSLDPITNDLPELPRYEKIPESDFSAAQVKAVRQSGPGRFIVTVVSDTGQIHDTEVAEEVCTQYGCRNGNYLEGYWLLIERDHRHGLVEVHIIDPARFHKEFCLKEADNG